MWYDFDLRKILRRYSPTWFRWPENQSYAYAFSKWLVNLHTELLGSRQVIMQEYKYSGLVHSMEWRLNDFFDPVLRRIYISIPNQLPVLYYLDDAEPPVSYLDDDGNMNGYFCLDEIELNAAVQYQYEFLVNVPVSLGFNSNQMFAHVDLYRYAGRRPAIRRFDTLGNTISITLNNG